MKFMYKISVIIIVTTMLLGLASCSNSSSTGSSPVDTEIKIADLPVLYETEEIQGRSPIAIFDAIIDLDNQTFKINETRHVQYHYPLSNLYPHSVQIADFGFSPNFWADIKLTHPLPGSGIDVFDPRVIAILPANSGVRFIYPSLYVGGNNAVIHEPDGYTKLFDDIGGYTWGNVNPFVAYFKDVEYRRWSSTDITEETKRWEIDLDGFGGPMHFVLVVDVSTNYPNPPTPVTDNASEPIIISSEVGEGLTPDSGYANVTVTLFDWQGYSSIGGVHIESPSLFDGTINLEYSSEGTNPNEFVYTGLVSNEKLTPEGEYYYLIAAWDQDTGIYTYNEFTLNVSQSPTSGNLMWAKRAGGTNFDKANAVTALSDNSTVVTGYILGTATFGPGEPNQTVLTSSGSYDVFIARHNPDGTLNWVKKVGKTGEDIAHGVTALSDDSFVVTGYFYGSIVFGLGEVNETTLNAYASYDYDMFIARYNPDGTLQWAKSAGNGHSEFGSSVTALSDDSTIAIGAFYGDSVFGKGESNETTLYCAGGKDIYIAKYNTDGTLAWAKSIGGTKEDTSRAVTTLLDNSIVVTGYFHTSSTFGAGEPNETTLNSYGEFDIFIAKYNPDGSLAWAKSAGGVSNNDQSQAVTSLSDNSFVVTGSFGGEATFGSGDPNETILTSEGNMDTFIARYDSDGYLVWAKRAGGPSNLDIGYGITTLSNNSIVITGNFYGSATFGAGETNETILVSPAGDEIFVARYNPNGTLAWAKHAGGSSWDDIGWSIASLSDDSTVVTGTISGTATFGPGEANQTILTSAGYTDIFIARFEP